MNRRPVANSATAIASTAERNWNLHRLTPTEEKTFNQDGFLVLPVQLPEAVTNGLEEAFDIVIASDTHLAGHKRSRTAKRVRFP